MSDDFESEFKFRPPSDQEFEEYKQLMEKFLKDSENLVEKLNQWVNLSRNKDRKDV